MNNIVIELDNAIKENITLKNELKNDKYPSGGIVYIIDYSTGTKKIYRLGMTGNMNARKKLYDTHSYNKREVILIYETKCPLRFETCIKAMLYNYRYKDRKDMYVCELSDIKKAFKICSNSINCMNQTGSSYILDEYIHILQQKKLNLQYQINNLLNEKNK